MKKITLLMLCFVVTSSLIGQITTTELFQFSTKTTGNPTWFSDVNIRSVAYYNNEVYALMKDTKIHVLNATTGAFVKSLDMTGVSGGDIAIGDIRFTSDGVLVATNCRVNPSTGSFKAYYWTDKDAVPAVLFEKTLTYTPRIGDSFDYKGTLANGELWTTQSFNAAGSTGQTFAYAIKFVITEGVASDPIYIALDRFTEVSSRIVLNADGTFWVGHKGMFNKFNVPVANATTRSTWAASTSTPLKAYTNAIKFFEVGGVKYFATVDYANSGGLTINDSFLAIYSYTTSTTTATRVFNVPVAGIGAGRNTSFYNGIDVKVDETGFSAWFATPTQGIAGYKFTLPSVATPVFSQEGNNITVSTATEGAEIRYTIDGSAPTVSSTLYVDGITLPSGTSTVKLLLTKIGFSPSFAEETYLITGLNNPTTNFNLIQTTSGVEVQLNGRSNIELYSISGQLIERTSAIGVYTRDLNKGMYIIRVNGQAQKFVR